jgi:hypothetical protein
MMHITEQPAPSLTRAPDEMRDIAAQLAGLN